MCALRDKVTTCMANQREKRDQERRSKEERKREVHAFAPRNGHGSLTGDRLQHFKLKLILGHAQAVSETILCLRTLFRTNMFRGEPPHQPYMQYSAGACHVVRGRWPRSWSLKRNASSLFETTVAVKAAGRRARPQTTCHLACTSIWADRRLHRSYLDR